MACTLCNNKPSSPCSPSSPQVPLLFVFTCPPPSLPPPLLCSCADQMSDALMGPVLSNGAGLEFDTLTPPISAVCHQEPHRMLSGRCLYCLLEFLWWVSGCRRTRYGPSNKFEVCPVGLNVMRVAFYCVDVFLINQITLLLDFPLLPWGSSLMQSGFVSRAMFLRNVWMKRFGPPLPRNETVSRAISWEWNVKRCNGFLREPSLGVFTVAFSVWLHYHNPASRPSQVFINHC